MPGLVAPSGRSGVSSPCAAAASWRVRPLRWSMMSAFASKTWRLS
ncbi:Uncharacterised protein [Mycobacteroides abscessus]|nr:Uncharacterised protein [Mycobacteroides abscessus]